MANVNDNTFKPAVQSAFAPGREVGGDSTAQIAENHNFLVTRSGHTLVQQIGAGEAILTDGTWRPMAYYVVHLHPRGGPIDMQLANTTGTAGYEFRFLLDNGLGTRTSSTANAGSFWLASHANTTTDFNDLYILVTVQVRRTSGSGGVSIGQLTLRHVEVTANPFTTQTGIYGLDSAQWDTTGAALDVRAVRHALDTTSTLFTAARRHLVTLCHWQNYGLTPAPTNGLNILGKLTDPTIDRVAAGLHTGVTGRRTYRIFVTGRNSAVSTTTYSMQVRGYADASFGFTITNTGNTVFTRGSWPAWNEVFQWSPSSDVSPWAMLAEVAAGNYHYLQALTIIEDAE